MDGAALGRVVSMASDRCALRKSAAAMSVADGDPLLPSPEGSLDDPAVGVLPLSMPPTAPDAGVSTGSDRSNLRPSVSFTLLLPVTGGSSTIASPATAGSITSRVSTWSAGLYTVEKMCLYSAKSEQAASLRAAVVGLAAWSSTAISLRVAFRTFVVGWTTSGRGP